MVRTWSLLIRDNFVIQHNNMKHLVVTVQQYEVCIIILIALKTNFTGSNIQGANLPDNIPCLFSETEKQIFKVLFVEYRLQLQT